MPYLVFAVIFANYGWILILLLCTSERETYILWLTKELGFLWSVTGFFMLIMIRRLRDISIEKFLDPNMPYPHRIKENMQKYLYAVFSPYKLKKEAPPWFKRHFNHLYSALPILLVGGAIGFISSYLDHRSGLVKDIIGGGGGTVGGWLFFVMMGCMMIGITNILRKLSKEFKNSNEAQSFASVVNNRGAKSLSFKHIILIYIYNDFLSSGHQVPDD
ncbi:hypothetical protein FHEFKHOI_01124 [Candidatus Methanoperedenaceae archaeon GB50]|nr:hypothetical protein AIOGIFDO_01116 [Candidatus Methanoperedenaceae archaeon GB37]CAD7771939.1 hypothetical protein FHEFKHOI_01124 [Candidatus Methanoperedenaceae archaeon GB50]